MKERIESLVTSLGFVVIIADSIVFSFHPKMLKEEKFEKKN